MLKNYLDELRMLIYPIKQIDRLGLVEYIDSFF